MIVVSDTSPLTALLTVGQSDLLAQIFGEVFIPAAVQRELLRAHAILPGWLKVQPVRDRAKVQTYAQKVDLGEAEAIALAEELQADFLLMDERKGRRLAQARHLRVIGLLGVIPTGLNPGLTLRECSATLRLSPRSERSSCLYRRTVG
jgi:hypothetical protein